MQEAGTSLVEGIWDTLNQFSDRPALWTRDREYSYRQLEMVASAIRRRIDDNERANCGRIGIVTSDDFETYAALLAIWSAGCAYVPINAKNPSERNAKIIEQAGVELVLSALPTELNLKCLPADTSAFEIADISGIDPLDVKLPLNDLAGDDLAYIFFTSGSTGVPKGVPISHGNLNAFFDSVHYRMDYDFSEHDRFLQMFELTFDLSVMSLFSPWLCGGCCCVVPERGIAWMNNLNVLAKQNISVALMVPSVLAYMERFFEELSLPQLRLSLFCGEALMDNMILRWSSCVPNARLENVYGPTEATIFCTVYRWESEQSKRELENGVVSIGKPMPSCDAVIVDRVGQVLSQGERGELALLGPQVMSGYWEDERRTRDVMVEIDCDGHGQLAYRTGDRAYVNEFGNLTYCGRLDSQVKIDGHRIELGEIEFFAREFIGSSKAAVVVIPDNGDQGQLYLFVAGQQSSEEELRNYLKAHLPEYMCPKTVVTLDDLPLNLNGKIDRPALVRRFS